MRIRKRILVLFLLALFVNGFALASVKTHTATRTCKEQCMFNARCEMRYCSWWDTPCRNEAETRLNGCEYLCDVGIEAKTYPESICPED